MHDAIIKCKNKVKECFISKTENNSIPRKKKQIRLWRR